MAEKITLTVSRYRPEEESEPTFQTYDVPYNEDWVILDALNYVKDQLDGSLTFRWSCRMGVCGSCGMMVNGTPKLTCAIPLSDYVSSGPIRIEPLQFFPVVRDLVIDISSFLEKLSSVKPWIIRDAEKPLAEGEYLQTPPSSMSTSSSACASTACCATRHAPSWGLNPSSRGRP